VVRVKDPALPLVKATFSWLMERGPCFQPRYVSCWRLCLPCWGLHVASAWVVMKSCLFTRRTLFKVDSQQYQAI
jgi:hypothetical protein